MLNGRSLESRATTSSTAALNAGSPGERVALDQDALAGGLFEAGIEDPVHAAGLARPGVFGLMSFVPTRPPSAEGDDDECEPAERGGLSNT